MPKLRLLEVFLPALIHIICGFIFVSAPIRPAGPTRKEAYQTLARVIAHWISSVTYMVLCALDPYTLCRSAAAMLSAYHMTIAISGSYWWTFTALRGEEYADSYELLRKYLDAMVVQASGLFTFFWIAFALTTIPGLQEPMGWMYSVLILESACILGGGFLFWRRWKFEKAQAKAREEQAQDGTQSAAAGV